MMQIIFAINWRVFNETGEAEIACSKRVYKGLYGSQCNTVEQSLYGANCFLGQALGSRFQIAR